MNITFYDRTSEGEPWVEELAEALPGARVSAWQPGAPAADYAVVWKPPQQLLDEQPRLKGIFNVGAGVDAICRLNLPQGVPLVRIDDGGMAVQMSEYVCHALIRHFREFDRCEADTRNGVWRQHETLSRRDFPVGIMGLGVLGERVARAVSLFEYPTLGWSRTPRSIDGVTCFSGEQGFGEFLGATRVLVNLLPLTPQTENIINRETLSRLLPGAYVINVARGAHVVDEDLLAAIGSGHVAGATLDVFRTEPLPEDHPFWREPKISLTPHTSARTLRADSIAQIAQKIMALEKGEPVAGIVDPAHGY
ncbi:glyoxylate/hydroxypyruvate reductase A [Diaphorobacter ruginosibacter]|uniref:Glyoxylate/hydroxypyruvate reductase A n=1 Tax=Diaphorobacter ruginosibacter TaxID=1715720 RepID=A0A7G9RMC9_9BURK|nr:glyoxylate/hydroxypyruvate reductase A [Diaphorobacter ruginosibacter]QNN56754.1 glyoxylate/hydroxypyruvate reductase A [Diaphorobacter ruginosibacter]